MNASMQKSSTAAAMQEQGLAWRREGLTVGLVPTMGYWHEGHLSLMRWARERCDRLVVSIFVNPTQFGPGEDLENYPSNLERDSELARAAGVDMLFTPVTTSMYESDHGTWVTVPDLTETLCGRSRPVHFRGVATIVTKLFNIVQPTFAAFGEKDWQQLAMIRKMTRELNMPVRIEGRPIVREADGLAMSSRNVYLTEDERRVAPYLQRGLQLLANRVVDGEHRVGLLLDEARAYYAEHLPMGRLDYLELVDPVRMTGVDVITGDVLAAVAFRLGKARLIDNIYIPFE